MIGKLRSWFLSQMCHPRGWFGAALTNVAFLFIAGIPTSVAWPVLRMNAAQVVMFLLGTAVLLGVSVRAWKRHRARRSGSIGGKLDQAVEALKGVFQQGYSLKMGPQVSDEELRGFAADLGPLVEDIFRSVNDQWRIAIGNCPSRGADDTAKKRWLDSVVHLAKTTLDFLHIDKVRDGFLLGRHPRWHL